jgi:FkbM family methyltransferase
LFRNIMRYMCLFKNVANWWLHFAVKFGWAQTDPLLFRTRNKIVIEVPRRIFHEFKEIFMEECYIRGLGHGLPNGPTVIDIGANAGFFTLFAASRFPGAKIFSYEPIPSNFRQLKRNKELNEKAEILCFPKAIYGYPGEVSLCFDPAEKFTTSATVFERSDSQHNTIRVPCMTLPQVFAEHRLESCDLLKMDCEGSEYAILYGCPPDYLYRIAQIAMEVHGGSGPDQDMESLIEYLNSHDFKTRPSGYMLWAWRES